MKILITGSNGLLGQKLVYALLDRKAVEVIATSKGDNRLHQKEGYEYISLDITNRNEVNRKPTTSWRGSRFAYRPAYERIYVAQYCTGERAPDLGHVETRRRPSFAMHYKRIRVSVTDHPRTRETTRNTLQWA
jgi:hypothetical protein